MNSIHSFRTENKLKSYEKVYKNKNLWEMIKSSEKDNILQFNQYMKSDKMSYIIFANIKSLIKKINECANNPEKSSATKLGEDIPCGYSMSAIFDFDNTENKHTLYRGGYCMKKFCTFLREHTTNVISFEIKIYY